MGMAGSLLPSHARSTLEPVTLRGVTFKIEPMVGIETYVLLAGGSAVAAHPNAFSLKELVTRIAACQAGLTDAARVEAQWDYILACGGMTKSKTALEYYLKGETP